MAAPDEFQLIADLFAPLAAGFPGALGLKDDAALISSVPGTDLVVTVDAMVAGVHFLPDDPPDLVARKLMRVNLSDLAAKGAVPVAVLLAAAFPKGTEFEWMRRFAAGLGEDLKEFNVGLAGGDTVATPGPLTLSLTAFGRVEAGRALLRSGARPGDRLWVTGSIGDGALGLLAAQGHLDASSTDVDFLAGRYRLPLPRIAFGTGLVGVASAAMDISDGLVQDLGHLCQASGVSARVRAADVPLSAAAGRVVAADVSHLATVLTGGDDYEILFTAPPQADAVIGGLAARVGCPAQAIGEIAGGEGVAVVDCAGNRIALEQSGWRHF